MMRLTTMSPSTEKKTKFKTAGKMSRREFLALPRLANKFARLPLTAFGRRAHSGKRFIRALWPLALLPNAVIAE